MASTTEELSSQAEQLKSVIAFFSLDTGKQRRTSPPPHRTANKSLAIAYNFLAKAPVKAKESGAIRLDMGGKGGANHLDEEFEKF